MHVIATLNLVYFAIVIIVLYYVHDKLDKQAKKFEEHEKWLFDSLYSIDNKVLLPKEQEKPMINKEATIYSPTEDGMAEFNGMKDDFYSRPKNY